MRLFPGLGKVRWLLHVLDFVVREYAIKESSLYVILKYLPVIARGDVKDGTHGLQSGCRRSGFTEILPPYLLEPLRNPLHFVLHRVAILIAFKAAHESSAQDFAVRWNLGTWDKLKDAHLMKTCEFLLRTLQPFFAVG